MFVRFPSTWASFLAFLIAGMLFPLQARPCAAQRGGFIEDLFRTVAEAQLQREQRKRIEADAQLNAPAPQSIDPREVPVPPSVFPRGPLGPATPPAGREVDRPLPPNRNQPTSPRGNQGSITVRSREAAEFVENLARFNSAIDPLVEEMKRGSANMPAIRPLLPVAYRVTADTHALLGRCDGLSAPQTLLEPYCDLDQRWRQLSFGLRSLDGLSAQCTASIRECDRVCALMARQLGVQPQFDRDALRQVMLTAATYMQSLMDDLSLANLSPQDRAGLIRDVRLLRQQLLTESANVPDASYEQVVTRFTDFVGRWQRVSAQVAGVRDPHVQLRLDRIAQCGTDTYALMWMPPPSPQIDVRAQAARLQKACSAAFDQLSLRAMVTLPRQEQIRIADASRQLDDKCRQLVGLADKRVSSRELGSLVADIDNSWNGVRGTLASLPMVDPSTLAEMDRVCGSLRQSFGGSAPPATLDYESLLAAAASLEGSTEYLQADMQRYERYLQPNSYREAVVRSTVELHEAAKQLHFELSRRADLNAIQRPADTIVHAFDRLSHDLEDVEHHGLVGSRAATIQRAQRDLVPVVAQIAAALLDH